MGEFATRKLIMEYHMKNVTSTFPAGESPVTAPSPTFIRACSTPPAYRRIASANQIEPCRIRPIKTDH